MALPPVHRIDAPAGYILQRDTCWDLERINAEIAEKTAEDPDWIHPVSWYYTGFSRYDLEPVREYWASDATPAIFYLRPLDLRDYAKACDMEASVGERQACLWAAERGVDSVESVPHMADYELGGRPKMSEQERRKLANAVGEYMIEIGRAVLNLNRGLTVAEGKRSGS